MSTDWSVFLGNTHTPTEIYAHTASFLQSENFCFGGTIEECRQSRHNIWIAARSLHVCVCADVCVCVAACVRAYVRAWLRSTGVGCGILGVSLTVKLEQK